MGEWRPGAGQTALIEPTVLGNECLTGTVLESDAEVVVIDLGGSPGATEAGCEVTASFFCPDALYRIDATLSPHGPVPAIIELAVHHVERIQRRTAIRAKVAMPVVLSNFDDLDADAGGAAFASVTGMTIDIAEGGCRVATNRRFPSGCDPTVTLHLSTAVTLVALAAVLEEVPQADGRYEYRLVFTDPDDGHRELLGKVIANA